MNNREYLAANPEKLAEVAAQGVCDCCAYREETVCGDCSEGVGKWLESEHTTETFHDEFYDCESTVDLPKDCGDAGMMSVAHHIRSQMWYERMTDSREKLEADIKLEYLEFPGDQQRIFAYLDRQAAITEREGREAWHKAASGEIYQANQRAAELQGAVNERNGRIARLEAENAKLQKSLDAMIGCPGYDAPSHRCRYHDQDFELNDRTVNALKRENAKLQEQIDRILKAPNLSKGVNMQLVEGVEALNERISDLEAEVEQYELLCQRWEDLYHAVRDQRNAMRDRLAELEKGEGHE